MSAILKHTRETALAIPTFAPRGSASAADDWAARDHALEWWIPAELLGCFSPEDDDATTCKYQIRAPPGVQYVRSPTLLDAAGAPVDVVAFEVVLGGRTLEKVTRPESVALLRSLRRADRPGSVPAFFHSEVGAPVCDFHPERYEFWLVVKIARRVEVAPELWLQHVSASDAAAAEGGSPRTRTFAFASDADSAGFYGPRQEFVGLYNAYDAGVYVLDAKPSSVDLHVDGRRRTVPGALLDGVGTATRLPALPDLPHSTRERVRVTPTFAPGVDPHAVGVLVLRARS